MQKKPTIHVWIDADTGRAIVSIAPDGEGDGDRGDAKVEVAQLEELCRKAKVLVTDEVQRRLALLVHEYNHKPRSMKRTIAQPRPAVDGTDGWIDWCEGMNPNECQVPAMKGDRVDHYVGCAFIHVRGGAIVGTIHAATPGTPGCDVSGNPIKPKPGSPIGMRIEAALRVEDDGSIVAQVEGALCIKRGALTITKLLEVQQHVDFSTGHINFDGSVEIREDVRDLFRVKATGNVSVGGLLECSTIHCGGNFVARRGMAGRRRGVLNVKGNAEVGFLNDMKGTIGGSLVVRREIINCQLRVDGRLAGEQCTLIGGTLDLRDSGVLAALGSPAQRNTRIHLSGPANLLVMKVIHPNVTIVFGRHVYRIERLTKGPVRIVASTPRSLAYRIADGAPRPMQELTGLPREAA